MSNTRGSGGGLSVTPIHTFAPKLGDVLEQTDDDALVSWPGMVGLRADLH